MIRKRADAPGSVEEERAALREQWLELDALKRELRERVQAVSERERELRAALTTAQDGRGGPSPLAPGPHPDVAALAARVAELDRREARLTARERQLSGEGASADAGTVVLPPVPSSDEQRLAEIEARLVALHEAEKAFLRTQQELSARSDALTQRERLVAQRERELDAREDSADTRPEVSELEARLRRLEQQRATPAIPTPGPALEDTQGFSGGLKRLKHQGTRRRPGT